MPKIQCEVVRGESFGRVRIFVHRRPSLSGYARRIARAREDDGSMLVEIVVASFVLAIAVIGVMGSMTSSMSLVGAAKQRSAGAQIAQERLERAHNVPFSRIALYETPTHSADASNPDYSVNGTNYNVDGSTTEPLIIDAANGALKHIDDPVILGTTQFNVYQYVTWHDDPTIVGTTDYKRVTIVVTWAFPVALGLSHRIVSSTYIGQAGIVPPQSSATPAPSPSSSPVATASPTPTASASGTPVTPPGNGCGTLGVGCAASGTVPAPLANGPCAGDHTPPAATAPTMQSGTGTQGFTNSTAIPVQVQTSDPGNCWPVKVELSNDGVNWATGDSLAQPISGSTASDILSWQVGSGDGRKGFYVRFSDANGNCCGGPDSGHAQIWEVDYTLDQTLPCWQSNCSTGVAGLAKSQCSISGSNRTATLTWNAASDSNFVGYRVYRSVNNGAFSSIAIPTAQTITDTTSKGDLVQYKVRAYDKAGNETPDGNPVNVVVFQKQTGNGSTCA